MLVAAIFGMGSLLISVPSDAFPFYDAGVELSCGLCPIGVVSSERFPPPVSVSITGPSVGPTGSAEARVDRGVLGASAKASAPAETELGGITALGQAEFTIPVTISGPAGSSGPASLRLSLNGSIDPVIGGRTGVFVFGTFTPGTNPGAPPDNLFTGLGSVDCRTGTCFPVTQSLLDGYSGGPVALTAPLGVVSPGDYVLRLGLQAGASARENLAIGGSGSSEFMSSLTFASSGPVFLLPDGFTANAPDGAVFDNLFAPGTVSPEPATIFFVGTTAAGIWLANWRRRSQRSPQP